MDETQKQIEQIKTWLGTGSINIFGIQFSGKDTQARRLAELLGGHVLSSGDIVRGSQRQDVINHTNQGNLAPSDQYLEIILPYLSRKEFEGKPLVLSSVGRWIGEEAGVVDAAAAASHPIKAAIYLSLPEEAVWNRWKAAQKLQDRGTRGDESEDALRKRLEEFHNKTLPVIDFYRNNNLLIEVDGSNQPEQVTTEILDKLSVIQKN